MPDVQPKEFTKQSQEVASETEGIERYKMSAERERIMKINHTCSYILMASGMHRAKQG